MLNTDEFKTEYKKIKEICGDKFVLGSTDRLSPLSGVVEKLAGYKRFLAKYPEHSKKVMLIQVSL